jgi:B12 binding domain
LTDTLLALDSVRAEQVLGQAFDLYAIEDVGLGLLQPMLVDVGARQALGEVSVAQEHFASSFIRAWLSALLLKLERGVDGAPLIVAGCAPEEWHEMGVGGQAFNRDPGLRALLGATYMGPDAAAAAEVATYLLGRDQRPGTRTRRDRERPVGPDGR